MQFIKLYLKLLRQFIEQQGTAVEQVAAALAQGDAGLAERVAHTLKGDARSLGYSALGDFSHRIEDLLDAATDDGGDLSRALAHDGSR